MKCLKLILSVIFVCVLALPAFAQSIPNPSFESDTFTNWPGYISGNSSITGWTASDPTTAGLNPASGSPFADNGATPDGTNVAFIQSTGSPSILSTTITGLTAGQTYTVSFRANCRSGYADPVASWSLDGGSYVSFSAAPSVGGSNPYYTISGSFTATSSTAALAVQNSTASDSALLIDAFTITHVDTTPPVVDPHSDVTAEATSAAGAVVTYSPATATDDVTPSPVITYSATSGSVFATGTTTVTIYATDAASNTGTGTFNVIVRDTTAPTVSHADVLVQGTSGYGTTVVYSAATASDAVTASPTITYSNSSGTVFPLGITTVTMLATDAAGNTGTGTFTVTVTRPTTIPVQWTGSTMVVLDASMIPTNTGSAGYTFVNPGNMGFDINVVSKALTIDGADTLPWNGDSGWWMQGPSASSTGKSVPYATVQFRFYQTNTTEPIAMTGVHFRMEDAEAGERFRNFIYWDSVGTQVNSSFLDYNIFSYSTATGKPVIHLSDGSVETGLKSESGTQPNKWVDCNLSALAVSGFSFQTGRENPSRGSFVLTWLGSGFCPATEFSIDNTGDINVSSGPNFVATGSSAVLTPATIESSLSTSDVSIATGVIQDYTQNIVVNQDIVSSSGFSLDISSTQSVIATAASLSLSSSSGATGNIAISVNRTIWGKDLSTRSTVANSGTVTLDAVDAIKLSSGIDTSADTAGAQGGDITLTASNVIVTGTLRTGGGAGDTPLGNPGNIVVTSNSSISVSAIYADSGAPVTPTIDLTSASISIGTSATTVAIDLQGPLTLQKTASASAAAMSISGTITGAGSLTVDAGTGILNLYSTGDYTGPTHMVSGTLAVHGKSLASSAVILDGSSGFVPGVSSVGGSVAVQTLTVGTNAFYATTLTSGSVYDLTRVSGTSSLNGIFSFSVATGFTPALGSTYEVLKFASQTGSFGSFKGVRLSDRVLLPSFTGTSMVLTTSTIATGASQPLQTVPDTGLAVAPGGYYDGLCTSTTIPGIFNAATVIGGTASQATTVYLNLLASGTSGFTPAASVNGTVLELVGSGTDKIVVQLDYDEAAAIAAVGDERNLFIASSDGAGPFANTVLANTDLPGEPNTPTQFFRAYNPATDFVLGYYGVDTVNNRVWAVIDHNSAFALGVEGSSGTSAAIATEAATNVTVSSASLNALVNPNGVQTSVIFECGTTSTLEDGTASAAIDMGSTAAFVPVECPLTGLAPNTTYYFRADAIAETGTQMGSILSFVTGDGPIITVTASTPDAYEQGTVPGAFTLSRTGTADVVVSYTVAGTAGNGTRYTIASGPVTVPASGTTVSVVPISNHIYDGDQTVILTLTPNSAYGISATGSAVVTIHDAPFDQWRFANFGANANDPAFVSDTAVANAAGIQNLTAYALGVNPATATAAALPQLGKATVSGTAYLTLNFTRNTAATDVTYTVEASFDLATWTSVAKFSGGAWSPAANVVETGSQPALNVQVSDSAPIGSGGCRFLRLRVCH